MKGPGELLTRVVLLVFAAERISMQSVLRSRLFHLVWGNGKLTGAHFPTITATVRGMLTCDDAISVASLEL